MFLLALVILESLEKLEEHLLGNLAASTLQVREPGEPEVSLQVMSGRVEGSTNGHRVGVLSKFELSCLGKRIVRSFWLDFWTVVRVRDALGCMEMLGRRARANLVESL